MPNPGNHQEKTQPTHERVAGKAMSSGDSQKGEEGEANRFRTLIFIYPGRTVPVGTGEMLGGI